ncbi:hypothetical protein [Arthrobacter sp. H35-D1]|uniref:hypothetical protein n=1 Tax=Arthrobacter sp. H35-D1 TaxID=3046202 RepID=UPI0024BA2506|nr:hypothetical protein [Arthrobacter sp. H35-D1]MDJ0313505.1 hypothetical protein [Arthrobacter sp. H35-D1]
MGELGQKGKQHVGMLPHKLVSTFSAMGAMFDGGTSSGATVEHCVEIPAVGEP